MESAPASPPSRGPGGGTATALRLIEVAIDHFGRLGPEGASTRSIAHDAGTMMSSITYHFGSKRGLYLAAADHIAAAIAQALSPLLAAPVPPAADIGPRAARDRLQTLFARLVDVMVADIAPGHALFIAREQAEPTDAFERLYDGAMGQLLDTIVGLLRAVAGGGEDEARAKVRAIALLGQVLAFRMARATSLRLIDRDASERLAPHSVQTIVAENVDAICDRLQADLIRAK